jgi:hypothetical protein
LTVHQISQLESFRRSIHPDRTAGYTYPELHRAMQPLPFKLDTLLRALAGKPVWEASHAAIVQWIDRFLPKDERAPQIDAKRRAAGEREENHGG